MIKTMLTILLLITNTGIYKDNEGIQPTMLACNYEVVRSLITEDQWKKTVSVVNQIYKDKGFVPYTAYSNPRDGKPGNYVYVAQVQTPNIKEPQTPNEWIQINQQGIATENTSIYNFYSNHNIWWMLNGNQSKDDPEYNCFYNEIIQTIDPEDPNTYFEITATAGNGGTVTLDGETGITVSKKYPNKGVSWSYPTAKLKANPNQNYNFVQWSDGNKEKEREVSTFGNQTYTATFRSNNNPTLPTNPNFKTQAQADPREASKYLFGAGITVIRTDYYSRINENTPELNNGLKENRENWKYVYDYSNINIYGGHMYVSYNYPIALSEKLIYPSVNGPADINQIAFNFHDDWLASGTHFSDNISQPTLGQLTEYNGYMTIGNNYTINGTYVLIELYPGFQIYIALAPDQNEINREQIVSSTTAVTNQLIENSNITNQNITQNFDKTNDILQNADTTENDQVNKDFEKQREKMEGLEKQQMDKINELVDLKQTVTAEEQIKAFQWLKKNSDKIIKDTGMTPYVTFAIIFGIAMLFLR